MRNNRAIIEHQSLIRKHQLNSQSPASNSLFWQMWQNGGILIADKALKTDFIQGIASGSLDPIAYGAFNVSDIYYCFNGAKDYQLVAKRATHPVLIDYFESKHQSYKKYNLTACAKWNLTGSESIAPTSASLRYSKYEKSVASGCSSDGQLYDPIYSLIVMLPCEFLWAWLAQQLSPANYINIYRDWITNNNDPSGAYAMGNFLEDYIQEHPIDIKLATDIYLKAMEFELENFKSATERN